MNYEEAKLHKQTLEERNEIHSNTLKSFKANSIGLVSEEVRLSTKYQTANKEYNKSFKELQTFNSWFVKTFKKEYQAERKNRFKTQ